ncbi:hypothetical protein ACQCRQ_13955, partial [Ralstonia pseudosolanacearum]
MNKHIRVLTGRHAGASLDLLPGDWTVDSADTAAVRISDWTDAPLQLQVGIETGVLHVDDEAAAPLTRRVPVPPAFLGAIERQVGAP